MSTASVTSRIEARPGFVLARCLDYWQLAKPRIAAMAMFAVTVGYLVGCGGEFRMLALLSACLGIGCVAVACSFLNQWLEQDTDRRMLRTADRPLAGRRVAAPEVLVLGLSIGAFGIAWLWANVNTLTALLSAGTLAAYVGIYTPLKRVSFLCTIIGAVAGALPPVLGWCAAGGELDQGAAALFLLLFCWQFPHFLAIATIYRADYESAALRMLPLGRDRKSYAGWVSVAYACALIPISLLVWENGLAGELYLSLALVGGVVYLLCSLRFLLDSSIGRARELLLCSIVYLPAVLLSLAFDHYRLLF